MTRYDGNDAVTSSSSSSTANTCRIPRQCLITCVKPLVQTGKNHRGINFTLLKHRMDLAGYSFL